MVHRWQCRDCEWTVWSAARKLTAREVKSHLVTHYGDTISQSSYGIQWTCTYCNKEFQNHDKEDGYEQYKEHLFSHVEPLMEADAHVADDLNGRGSVLVLATPEGLGADNARKHFLSPANTMVFVTARPEQRIQLVREELGQLPSRTVVITSRENPLEGLPEADPSSLPVDVVRLGGSIGLSTLGKAISRVLADHEGTKGKISFEFDILSELITTFDLQEVFKFLHVLTSRLEDANALSHFYANPDARAESSINVLDQIFDMRLTANENVFVSEP
jgi:hypothetical protein